MTNVMRDDATKKIYSTLSPVSSTTPTPQPTVCLSGPLITLPTLPSLAQKRQPRYPQTNTWAPGHFDSRGTDALRRPEAAFLDPPDTSVICLLASL